MLNVEISHGMPKDSPLETFFVSSGDQRMRVEAIMGSRHAAGRFLKTTYRRGRLYRLDSTIRVSRQSFDDPAAFAFDVSSVRDFYLPAITDEGFEPIIADEFYTAFEISRAASIPLEQVEAAIESCALVACFDGPPELFAGDLVQVWLSVGAPVEWLDDDDFAEWRE